MKANQTALVLVEFQNDFTTEKGALHRAVKTVMESSNMLKNTIETVEKAREAGVTIIHAPISFVEGFYKITSHPYGILKGGVDSNAFVKDTWGCKIVDSLTPRSGDIIVEGKRGFDTFARTNLDFILRSKGITNLVLTGFLTDCCVESRMRSGYEKGFKVFTLTDCMAATSQEEHDAAIKYTYPMFSRAIKHEDFLSSIETENKVQEVV